MARRSSPADNTRNHLEQVIGGLIDGVIFINPDGKISWANDAALKMHGAETLADLGGTVRGYCRRHVLRYRNNRKLEHSQYPIHRLFEGIEFDSVVVEVSRKKNETCRMLKTRGLTLQNMDDKVVTYVMIMEDLTDQFEAEQRFERAFNANPAPALICRLSDLRYIRVNMGFLDMTGYLQRDLLGRSVYDIDILANAQDKERALAGVHEGTTIPQMESMVPLPDGGSKHVILAGQPLEECDGTCMLFTFIDLDPRKQAEDALRQMEERFSRAFRLAPVPMMLCTLDSLHIMEVNDAFLTATGLAFDDTQERDINQLPIWHDTKSLNALHARLEAEGSLRNEDIQLYGGDDEVLDCLLSADTVTIQNTPCVLMVIQDITERKHTEGELLAALDAVMQDTSWFSRTVIEKLAQIRRPGSPAAKAEVAELTPREREILGLMCQGASDAQISEQLTLSRNTIRNHVATIYNKIDVHRRSNAIIWGRERGFLGPARPAGRGRRR